MHYQQLRRCTWSIVMCVMNTHPLGFFFFIPPLYLERRVKWDGTHCPVKINKNAQKDSHQDCGVGFGVFRGETWSLYYAISETSWYNALLSLSFPAKLLMDIITWLISLIQYITTSHHWSCSQSSGCWTILDTDLKLLLQPILCKYQQLNSEGHEQFVSTCIICTLSIQASIQFY